MPGLRLLAAASLLCLMSACSSTRSVPENEPPPDAECPPEIQDQIQVSASASRSLPAAEDPRSMSVRRRVVIALSPTPAVTGLRVLSSVATVTTAGGTFAGMLGPKEASDRAIDVIPGRLRITPFILSATLRPQTFSMDTLVTTGGAPLDEMVVVSDTLWDSQLRPLSADDAKLVLEPTRHFAMYDEVRATVSLRLVVEKRRPVHQRLVCVAEAPFTLVDRAATTPGLWDLRVAADRGRSELWLALFSPQSGPIRAVFASPEQASAFANWLRQTRSTHIGAYQVGTFRPEYSRERLRTVPASHSVADTFKAASRDDIDALITGRLGEP